MPGSRLGAEEGEYKQGVSIDCGREVWDAVGGIWGILWEESGRSSSQLLHIPKYRQTSTTTRAVLKGC